MKTIKFFSQFTAAAFLLGLCSVFASAQATTASNLEMNALVETSVQLNISTGTGGAAVTGTAGSGLFAVDFGSVNGLGLSPATDVTAVADATGATYSTPINITPIYTGFTTETADVTVEAGASTDQAIAREGASAITMSAVTVATPAFSGVASGSNNERFVGFRIARIEEAGANEATLIYTVTIQ